MMTALQLHGGGGRLAAWRPARFHSVRSHLARWVWLPIVLGLSMGSSAFAIVPQVKDDGKFFSAEAVEKANRVIGEIEHQFHRDLVIETFATVPTDKVEQVKGMDAKAREQFYHTWALERARSEQLNGVFVLITKEPKHIQAVSGRPDAAEGVHAARSEPAGRGFDQGPLSEKPPARACWKPSISCTRR